MNSLKPVVMFAASLSLLLACGEKTPDENDGESSSEGTSTTTDATTTTDGTTTDGTTTTDDTTTTDGTTTTETTSGSSGFVDTDMQVGGSMCDIWTPGDCGDEEKCMPYAMMGETWDALKCSPLDDNPKVLGDECLAPEGAYGGIDDCGAGLYCYYINNETNIGSCIEFCTGSPTTPMCGPEAICTIVNDGVLVLCRPECDPTIQDCEPAGSGCYQATGTGSFTCIIDKSEETGVYGDSCTLISTCDPGLACLEAAAVPGCTSESCCSNFCDLNSPNTCPDAGGGQLCEAYYEQPDPGYEHVGICALPMGDVDDDDAKAAVADVPE